jgi:hypothetical protein
LRFEWIMHLICTLYFLKSTILHYRGVEDKSSISRFTSESTVDLFEIMKYTLEISVRDSEY